MSVGFAAIAIVIAYAGFSGLWVENSGTWYESLRRPWWQPPNFVFGLIWPYNFIMLAILGWNIAGTEFGGWWLTAFALSVLAATLWSYLFYKARNLDAAAIALVISALTTLPMTYLTAQFSTFATVFFLPYQLWILVAASLATGYAYLNRGNSTR